MARLDARHDLAAFDERSMLEGVIEATEAATWDWDVPADEVRINERWANLIGYAADELRPVSGQSFRRFIHPDDQPLVDEALRAHFAGEARNFDCEIRMRHRNGDWIWIQTRGRVLTWAPSHDPERMCGVHLPIGERKAAEERLRRSQELLSLTGQVAGVGGYEVNLITNVITWTDQTKRIHGVPLDYQPKMDVAINFYAPQARPVISQAVEQAIATGTGWDLELPLDRADGRRIWVRAQGSVEMRNGAPVRLFGAFQDITERRRLTEQLAEKHELMHVTLESIGDAVITTDRSGLITWMNPVAERLTGLATSQAMGQPVASVYRAVDETSRTPSDPVAPCLEQRSVINLPRDALLLTNDGEEYAVEDTASPIVNSAGELLGAVVVFYDVTERRRLNSEMTYRARHDSLTGLLNRSEFEARLEEARQETLADDSEHALLYLDLDQF
ncbi:MAG: PAS domain-containing protein, partial [Pseudomonadota bacterium]